MMNAWWNINACGTKIIPSVQNGLPEYWTGTMLFGAVNVPYLDHLNLVFRCRECGLIERCIKIEPRDATPEELLKLHTRDRLELLAGTDGSPDAEALEAISSGYDAVYIHPSTHKLALLAAGSAVELIDSILDGKAHNGMAVIRYFLSNYKKTGWTVAISAMLIVS